MTYDDVKNSVEMTAAVNYQDDTITFTNADCVVFDKTSKELTITGADTFSLFCELVVSDVKPVQGILKYTLGKQRAYLY